MKEFICQAIKGSNVPYNQDEVEGSLSVDSLILPASCYSKIFWIDAMRLSSQEQYHYHVYGIFHYFEKPDRQRLEMALQILVNNNYNLRTRFVMLDERLHQIIKHNQTVKLNNYSVNNDEQFDILINEIIHQPFDFDHGPLFRFTLIFHHKTKATIFIPVFHHIILDGTQFDSLMQQISDYYHHPIELDSNDEAEIEYLKNYLSIEQTLIEKSSIQFWIEKLSQYRLQIHFPIKNSSLHKKNDEVHRLYCLDQLLYMQLKEFSKKNNYSLFHILKTVWAILISIYSNQEKLVISFPVNMRGKKYTYLKGAFVNTLFYFFEKTGTFLECLTANNNEGILEKNRFISRAEIISALKENEYDFSVFFSQSNLFIHGPFLNTKPMYEPHRFVGGIGNAMLCLFYQEDKNLLKYGIAGLSEWVDAALLKQMHHHFEMLLTRILTEPNISLENLSCLSIDEYKKMVYSWNETSYLGSIGKSIHQLFEEQSEKTPNNIAIVYEDTALTYLTVNDKSNQLAHYLQKTYFIKNGDLIAVCLERSDNMIIAFLAILKTGAAYIPISPHHLGDYFTRTIHDAHPKVTIVGSSEQRHFNQVKNVLILDTQITQQMLSAQPLSNLGHFNMTNQQLAYVMYTSGTTGKPKGVMIEHRSVVSLTNKPSYITIDNKDAIIQLADIAFDASIFEIYIALLNGATLFIPKDSVTLLSDPRYFKNYLIENKISVLWLTKTLFDQLFLSLESIFDSLEYLIIGGEPLNYSLIRALSESKNRPRYLLNGYGPTECTIFSTIYSITKDNIGHLRSVPIGKPVSGRTAYILDQNLNPLPPGVVGELYIGGTGLARGYLNEPDLTEKNFIINPFQNNEHLYKTGDLACYLQDGNIEYIGRNDFQVKIHGYRIELTEIENKLSNYSEIKGAVVITFDKSDRKCLIAYYVSEKILDHELILEMLRSSLPNYMLPSMLVHLEYFPITKSGKLDRNALPEPVWCNNESYTAPRNQTEQQICTIYAKILELPVESISIQANFFGLGGNSILALQAAHQLSQVFDIKLPIADMFRSKSVVELAKSIEMITTKDSIIPIAESTDQSAGYPLSFSQESLLFIEKYGQDVSVFHIPYVLKLKKNISLKNVKIALQSIVERHAILRTLFIQNEMGIYHQCIQNTPLSITTQLCGSIEKYQQILTSEINRPFNLKLEYPIRVCFYKIKETNEHYLLINMHHIAFDGWSINIFQNELIAFYHYFACNKPLNLPILSVQYKDFSVWEKKYLSENELKKQLDYWHSRLINYETLQLATDHPRPSQLSYIGKTFTFSLTPTLSFRLRQFAKSEGFSLYTVLLSGFFVLLNKYSEQKDIILGTPFTNRPHQHTKDLIGLFVNILLQREKLDTDQSITHLIKQIHQHAIEAQQHKDIPFEKIVKEIVEKRDISRHLLFQITFSVQHFWKKNKEFEQHFHPINTSQTMTSCDIGCLLDDSETTLHGMMLYSDKLFEKSTIHRFSNHYINILSQVVNESDKPLKSYQVLTSEEYHRIIYEWNKKKYFDSSDKTIHQLFEEQVDRTPNDTALIYEEKKLTYRELNQRANQLAHCIIKQGINLETPIGLLMERSPNIIIGMLGILKSGGTCVPLDVTEPLERLQTILDDTKLSILLIDEKFKKLLFHYRSKLFFISIGQDISERADNFPCKVTSNHLAFLVYTSGSTGVPKGVMLPHRVFSRCDFLAKNIFSFIPSDKFLFKSSRAPEELLFPLFIGASLVIAPTGAEKDPNLLIQTIKKNKINVVNVTPSFLQVLLDFFDSNKNFHLKHVFCAGELLSVNLQHKFFSYVSAKLYNFYGLAEAPYTTYWLCSKSKNLVLIGKPIDASVYILNSEQQPVPMGAIGEIYVGGNGLACGYLNQQELTNEKFIVNPFQKNTLLYKTGDLARYLSDGNIEYIGRKDFQIKLRGFRIELGEIEYRLAQYPGVKQAVVMLKETHSKNTHSYLVGYYTADVPLNESTILYELSRCLPEYMVPSCLVYLKQLPLNSNGKLNRKALPQPTWEKNNVYIAPRNKTEQQICHIYSELLSLSINEIGIYDNFFSLGGNSILAMQVAHRLCRLFNIHFPVAEIFRTKTIVELAKSISAITTKNIIIPKVDGLAYYPLSFSQERLWFIEQYEQGTAAYHLPRLVKLKQTTSFKALEKSFQSIIKRHQVLRTLFIQDEMGKEFQCIKDVALPIHIRSCKTKDDYYYHLKNDINQPFNLRSEYPIRVCLYKISKTKVRYLLVNMHHIACDGWSTDIFQKELILYYEYYHLKKEITLPSICIQYKDFALWQRNYLAKKEFKIQLDYWRNRLKNYPILHLPSDKPRTSKSSYVGSNVTFSLSMELSIRLKSIAQRYGTSLFSVLLSGFYVLLYKYTGQDDIIIGTPIANRHYESVKDLIGFFVNLLVLRERIDVHQPITYLMLQIHEHLIEGQAYQDIPFEKLIQELNVERDRRHHPLFQVLFSVQNFGKNTEIFKSYYDAVDITQLHTVTRYDLEFFIDDSHSEFQGIVTYAVNVFNESTISRLIEHYQNILIQLSNESDKPVSQYQVLSSFEYQKIIYDWNQTKQPYPEYKTIHQLFEKQVEKTPNHIAVVYQDTKLTYNELNERANQLAHFIRNTYSILPDDLIPLCLERSLDMIVSILGVLKSGAAYVPINPTDPEERIYYIIRDTKAKILITHQYSGFTNKVLDHYLPILVIDSQEVHKNISQQVCTNPSLITTSRHLAYVIYTSGTTGKPNGVMIEHHSVNNLLFSLKNVYSFRLGEKSAAFTHYTFDVSVSEFFIPLIQGAELHLLSDVVRKDLTLLSNYVQSYEIHYLYLPPALLSLFPRITYHQLRAIIYAGEVCDAEAGQYWSSQCKLFNYFGPTETTIYALGKQIIHGDVHLIGKPISNTMAYILDNDLNPVPIGSIGELYIGGVGLARGYLNQPELTKKKFIENPFQKYDRLYKTGDLVRHLPDGNIEYIGRNDFQVKIRGFRIELGEIEQQLQQYPGIKQALVLAKKKNEKSFHQYLVGYYVSNEPQDDSMILQILSHHLPDYMIPATLVAMEKFPLTINGKVDIQSLPKPIWKNTDGYTAPKNNTEQYICDMYSELFILPVDTISTQSNFFHLGGNSLLAIQVAHRISRRYEIQLPISEIFRTKTIEELAKSIASISTKNIIIPVVDGIKKYPLSFAQERLWFIEQYEQGTAAYHMPRLTKLNEAVSLKALIQALKAIVDRHEILRTILLQDKEGKEYQWIKKKQIHVKIQFCYTETEFKQYLKEDVNRPFDLRSEYPIRISVYQTKERYLLVNMHHIACDGWSIDIFQKELIAYYEYFHLNQPIDLPTLSIQYKDFALWQRNYLAGEKYERQLNYWCTRLAGYEPLRLSTDKPRPSQLSYAGDTFFFYLSSELSSKLRMLSQKYDYSLYVILLSGFYVLMHQCSQQNNIILGVPAANRHYESIKDLIGTFINVIAQREQLDIDRTIIKLMNQIHQHLIEDQEHQDIPFEKLLQELNIPRDIRYHPLFQVMFSVQSFGNKEEKYAQYFESIDITDIHPITRYDLACFVSTANPIFKGLISYSTKLFEKQTMKDLLQQYIIILTQMVNEPNKPLKAYQPFIEWKKIKYAYPISTLSSESETVYVCPRNSFERKICYYFSELLSIPNHSISIDADFFQLGGNSILAMKLASRLTKLFGYSFPIIEIFQSRTIEKLAKLFNQPPSISNVENFIVPLRETGIQSPLFLISGGHGEGFTSFMPIIFSLKAEIPVYGIRSKLFDPHWVVPKTLREQSEAIFKSIKKIQPNGPYYFLGACIGGTLAVQLQQLSEENGEPPGMVILINSYLLFNQIMEDGSQKGISKVKNYYTRLKQFLYNSDESLLERMKQILKRMFLEVYLHIPKRTEQYYCLLSSIEPIPLQSDLHLLFSSDEHSPDLQLKKWQSIFKTNAYLYALSGDHHSIWINEQDKIAGIINKAITEILVSK